MSSSQLFAFASAGAFFILFSFLLKKIEINILGIKFLLFFKMKFMSKKLSKEKNNAAPDPSESGNNPNSPQQSQRNEKTKGRRLSKCKYH